MTERSALEVLTALRASEDIYKAELSEELEEVLQKEPRNVSGTFLTIINRIIRSGTESRLNEISNSEFWNIRVSTYVDIDGKTRVAAGIAYVQDFDDADSDLDNRVMRMILDALKEANLDFVFNDICVNLLQSRNGSMV